MTFPMRAFLRFVKNGACHGTNCRNVSRNESARTRAPGTGPLGADVAALDQLPPYCLHIVTLAEQDRNYTW